MRRAAVLAAACAAVGATLFAPGAVTAATTTYQAENATIFHGVVESNHAGFTGTGFVNYTNEVGSYVQWSITVGTAGGASLVLRYANGTTANRPMTIAVDGATVATPSFAGTGAWTTWRTATVSTTLSAGHAHRGHGGGWWAGKEMCGRRPPRPTVARTSTRWP